MLSTSEKLLMDILNGNTEADYSHALNTREEIWLNHIRLGTTDESLEPRTLKEVLLKAIADKGWAPPPPVPEEEKVTLDKNLTANISPLGWNLSMNTLLQYAEGTQTAVFYYNVPEGATQLYIENITSDGNKLRIGYRNTTEIPAWDKATKITPIFSRANATDATIELLPEHKQLFFFNGGVEGGVMKLAFRNSEGTYL